MLQNVRKALDHIKKLYHGQVEKMEPQFFSYKNFTQVLNLPLNVTSHFESRAERPKNRNQF